MRILTLIAAVCVTSGCTHNFLRANTPRHISTVADIFYQQVIDNIAAYEANPGTLPEFAVMSDGTNQVQDGGQATSALTWTPSKLMQEVLNLQASRSLNENWKFTPVNTAGRLKKVRCAF